MNMKLFALASIALIALYMAAYGTLRVTGIFMIDTDAGFVQILPYYNAGIYDASNDPGHFESKITGLAFLIFLPVSSLEEVIRNSDFH